MTLLINDEKKIIFEYSAKSNSTVICKMFFQYIRLLEKALIYDPWIHNYEQRQYNPRQNIKKNISYIKIKFIRNPYHRAVSSYIHVMRTSLRNFLPKHLRNISFLVFLRSYNNIKSIPGSDHFTPQFGNYGIDFFHEIVKVENLDDEILRINNKYNLDLNCSFTSSHWVSSSHWARDESYGISNDTERKLNDINYSIIGSKKLLKIIHLRKLPHYEWFYTTETRKLVEEIYKKDIDIYFSV